MSQANNLLEIWDTYSKQVLCEKKTPKVTIGKKEGSGSKDLDDKSNKGFAHKDSGPATADGVKPADDPVKTGKANKDVSKFSSSDKKLDEEIRKTTKAVINNNMKSNFDKLYEEVINGQELSDAQDLGIDVGDESSDEVSDEGTEDVTITLTRDQVDCLKAILSQVEGTSDEVSDEASSDEDLELAEDEPMGEAVDAEEIGHAIKDEDKLTKGLTKAKSNEVGNLKTNKGKAESKFTDKVGADGTLADSKGQGLIKGSNKVASKLNKPGQSAFEV